MLLDAYNSEENEDEDEDWFDYSAVDEIPQSQAGFKRGVRVQTVLFK